MNEKFAKAEEEIEKLRKMPGANIFQESNIYN